MNNKVKFKDECDLCKKWQFDCKGYNGMVLCPDCVKIEEQKKKETPKIKKKGQLTLFDFIGGENNEV